MGSHLSVLPDYWSISNNWRVMGIRPDDSDHDLILYSRSIFDNPFEREFLESSTRYGDAVDFITVDGNHWDPTDQEHYVVKRYSSGVGYSVNWSTNGSYLDDGVYGFFTMGNSRVVTVFDVLFHPGETKRIEIWPSVDYADLGVRLYQSDGSDPSTWHQAMIDQVAGADSHTDPHLIESFVYTYTGTDPDYLGLVVYKKEFTTDAGYYIYVDTFEPIYLPIIRR
jgi:hypothetical protein